MTYYVSFLLLVSEIQQKLALGNSNIKDKNCSSQEVISDIESGNCDEDEDIALTFCDERNINHITVDNYVPRNNCEAEFNSESVNKKVKVPFLHPAAVYYGYQNSYHHKTYSRNEKLNLTITLMGNYVIPKYS